MRGNKYRISAAMQTPLDQGTLEWTNVHFLLGTIITSFVSYALLANFYDCT
jgi:hypothetical protein